MFLDNIKTQKYFKKGQYETKSFKRRSKFQKFQLSNFTLTWSNERKVNSVLFGITYSKELQQKMKILGKLILKNI